MTFLLLSGTGFCRIIETPEDTISIKRKLHCKVLMQKKSFALNHVHFISEKTGYAVGQQCLVLKTEDGGKTWNYLLTSKINNWLYSAAFHGRDSILLVGESGTMLASGDGGKKWKSVVSHTSDTIFSLSFCAGKTGFASGGKGMILLSKDQGNSWRKIKSNTDQNLYSVFCLHENLAYA
ncbi:MAG: WD40/YVTN/BNR-like repeat-containing protein, partial [Cytophagaceae bacterium]